MDQEKDEARGFRVTDRRRFTEGAERREDESVAETAASGAAPPGRPESPSGTASGPAGGEAAAAPEGAGARHATAPSDEEMTFSTFVLGLSTQALMHLGEIPDPHSGGIHRDFEAARQVIDILGILKQKTTNNLDQAEQALLESALYDLRMRFVQLVRGGTAKEGS